jgi:hypothetical protein
MLKFIRTPKYHILQIAKQLAELTQWRVNVALSFVIQQMRDFEASLDGCKETLIRF